MKTDQSFSFITAIRVLHRHLTDKPRLTWRERKVLRALDRCYYTRNHQVVKIVGWGLVGVFILILIIVFFFI